MRNLALFSYETTNDNALDARCVEEIATWLVGKGARRDQLCLPECTFTYRDGRVATLTTARYQSGSDMAWTFQLTEPVPGGSFRTTVDLGRCDGRLLAYCSLEAGAGYFSPTPRPDVHLPTVLRRMLSMATWRFGSTVVPTRKIRLLGTGGGEELATLLLDLQRTLPVVAVSEDSGFLIHPGLDDDLTYAMTGQAIIVSLDEDASWELTRRLGREWSCFLGAVRVYWPRLALTGNPFAHPLWTASRLMMGVSSTEEAGKRIAAQLRQTLMELSSVCVSRPATLDRIRNAALRERYETELRAAVGTDDFVKLAELYAAENERLVQDKQELLDRIGRLEIDVQNARLMHAPAVRAEELPPETEAPPANPAEAVKRLEERYGGSLLFGADVARGVSQLAQTAGPPDKLFRFGEVLARLAQARKAGSLGTDMVQWLKAQGVSASGESEMVRKSKDAQRKRTVDCGDGTRRVFLLHLKPNEATSPDKCVRIYFDWSDSRKKIVVGWVGPHPD
jgi:hypothetical protein